MKSVRLFFLLLIVVLLSYRAECKLAKRPALSASKRRSPGSKNALFIDQSRILAQSRRGSSNNVVCHASMAANPQSQLPSLLFINTLMFLFYASLGAVMPYLPIYYRHLGLNDAQLGLLGAITPAVTFVVSPLWGALADMTGRHKEILILTFSLSILFRTLLLLFPSPVAGLASSAPRLVPLCLLVGGVATLFAPVKPLLDSAVMGVIKGSSGSAGKGGKGAGYGGTRMYGQVGFGVGSFLVGPFLSRHIRAIFFMQLLLAVPALYMLYVVKWPTTQSHTPNPTSSQPKPPTSPWANLKAFMATHPPAIAFFLLVFLIGVSSGIVENFAYVRLAELDSGSSSENKQNLGANLLAHLIPPPSHPLFPVIEPLLTKGKGGGSSGGGALAMSRLLSSLAGVPMFSLSDTLTPFLPPPTLLSITLLSYIVRFLVYAYSQTAYHALPAEILRGGIFALFWGGATSYVYGISPPNMTATMLGLLNGIYGGLGQSLGSLIGGELSRRFGIAKAFTYCAVVDTILLIVYVLGQF